MVDWPDSATATASRLPLARYRKRVWLCSVMTGKKISGLRDILHNLLSQRLNRIEAAFFAQLDAKYNLHVAPIKVAVKIQ